MVNPEVPARTLHRGDSGAEEESADEPERVRSAAGGCRRCNAAGEKAKPGGAMAGGRAGRWWE